MYMAAMASLYCSMHVLWPQNPPYIASLSSVVLQTSRPTTREQGTSRPAPGVAGASRWVHLSQTDVGAHGETTGRSDELEKKTGILASMALKCTF